jgi:formate dehydrogenase subunit gamma
MSASPEAGVEVERFGAGERAVHWAFAAGYLTLLASGLPLMFPALRGLIRDYTPVVGLRLHLAAAIVWVLATAVAVLLADRRRLGRTWRELTRLERADAAWLRRFPRWLLAGPAARARLDAGVGRFNGGQKVNAVFTAVTALALLASGVALLPVGGGLLAEHVTGAGSVAAWRVAHGWLTLAVLLPLAGHLFLALVHPPTRPALPGMVRGRVDAAWARRHHPGWRARGANGRDADAA